MISLFTGTPGSGKSLDVAQMIYYKLMLGHTVIGNMRVRPERVKKCKGKYIYVDTYHMNPTDFIKYADKYHRKGKEGQTFIVIDECQQIFNSRDWADKGRRSWNEFFQVHRHFGFNVWLITQYDRLIDRQLRALVEYNYVHRKISNFGLKGKIISLFFHGGLFVKVGEWYPVHESTGSEFFIYKKKYGEFYDSYSSFSDSETVCFDELKPLLTAVDERGLGGPREAAAVG